MADKHTQPVLDLPDELEDSIDTCRQMIMNLTILEEGPITDYLKKDNIRMPFIVLLGLIDTIIANEEWTDDMLPVIALGKELLLIHDRYERKYIDGVTEEEPDPGSLLPGDAYIFDLVDRVWQDAYDALAAIDPNKTLPGEKLSRLLHDSSYAVMLCNGIVRDWPLDPETAEKYARNKTVMERLKEDNLRVGDTENTEAFREFFHDEYIRASEKAGTDYSAPESVSDVSKLYADRQRRFGAISKQLAPKIHAYIRENGLPAKWPIYTSSLDLRSGKGDFGLESDRFQYVYAFFNDPDTEPTDRMPEHMTVSENGVIYTRFIPEIRYRMLYEPEYRDDYDEEYARCKRVYQKRDDLIKKRDQAKKDARTSMLWSYVKNLFFALFIGIGTTFATIAAIFIPTLIFLAIMYVIFCKVNDLSFVFWGVVILIPLIIMIIANKDGEYMKNIREDARKIENARAFLGTFDREMAGIQREIRALGQSGKLKAAEERNRKKYEYDRELARLWQDAYYAYVTASVRVNINN